MLEEVLKLDKITVLFSANTQHCVVILLHNEREEDLLKADFMAFLEIAEEYRPTKTLWDLRNFKLVIDLTLQTWIDEYVNQREFELGITKEAFVMPNDMIVELSVEQTMDENFGQNIETALFTDREEALTWLLADSVPYFRG